MMFRHSKVRNLYGVSLKREFWYENIKVTLAPDADSTKVNPKYIGVILESGSGSFAVIDNSHTGRLNELCTFKGHSAPIIDLEFNPFNDNMIATASDDALVMLWSIPESGPQDASKRPEAELQYHVKKVTSILFHPTASDCLASMSADLDIVLWDLVKLEPRSMISCHDDIIHSMCWNYNGSLLVTTSRDKNIRITDVRAKEVVAKVSGHTGTKSSRQVWLGDTDYFATTGFSRLGERQIYVWDMKSLKSPIDEVGASSGSGVLLPFYDEDICVLYTAGKGDGSVEYYEWCDNSKLSHISSYKSSFPLRDLCFYPKTCCSVEDTEVAKALQVHPNCLEPVSFRIPRRTRAFSPSIYKDTIGSEPSMTVDEFFDGKSANPIKVSMRALSEGKPGTQYSRHHDTRRLSPKSITTISSDQADIITPQHLELEVSDKVIRKTSSCYRKSLEERVRDLEYANKILNDKVETLQQELKSKST